VKWDADVGELRQDRARQQLTRGAGATGDYEDGRALFEGDYMIVVVAHDHRRRSLAEKQSNLWGYFRRLGGVAQDWRRGGLGPGFGGQPSD
jgi:hypothetical protein